MTLKEQLKQMQDATMARMPRHIIKTFQDSITSLKRNRLKENALGPGDFIPNTPLHTMDGKTISLTDVNYEKFLILNFYRGGWCPFCNLELREYEKLKKAFEKVGADIVAISSEKIELANNTAHKNSISYSILTDVNAQLMKELGIVFQLDKALKTEFQNFGIDLSKIHNNSYFELPVPAVYVIDKNGKIVFTHIEEDHMTRLEPFHLIDILENILTTEKL